MKRLPFRVPGAPAIFQRVMEMTFAGVMGVSAYLENIIVSKAELREHNEPLNEVLCRLEKVDLQLKQEKCKFVTTKLNFLRHVNSTAGVHILIQQS